MRVYVYSLPCACMYIQHSAHRDTSRRATIDSTSHMVPSSALMSFLRTVRCFFLGAHPAWSCRPEVERITLMSVAEVIMRLTVSTTPACCSRGTTGHGTGGRAQKPAPCTCARHPRATCAQSFDVARPRKGWHARATLMAMTPRATRGLLGRTGRAPGFL